MHADARQDETPQQTQDRLDDQRRRQTDARQDETPQQTQDRLAADAQRHADVRDNESDEETEHRLAINRERIPRTHRSARMQPGQGPGEVELDLPSQFSPGAMTVICDHCLSLSFPGENFKCCHLGKVTIPSYAFPEALESLFTDQSPQAKNFRQNIRKYNTLFSFASMTSKLELPPGSHNIFRISGQIHHRLAALYPPHAQPPAFGQLYIYQSDDANNFRMQNSVSEGCLPAVMDTIALTLAQVNPFLAEYQNMHEKILEENRRAREAGEEPLPVRMYLRVGPDRRRYNTPLQNEVAAIFTGLDGAADIPRDVVVYPHQRHLHTISIYSPNCDPMCFPLLFPSGEPGWEPNIPHNEEYATGVRSTTTCLQYSVYRWADRGTFNPLHHAGLLAQHKLVDDYVRVEAHRLDHQRKRQSQLRVECLQGLYDHVYHAHNLPPSPDDTGIPVILPSSFQGSSRNMSESFQDALAIVRNVGKPDLFITFTCNTRWPEITSQLKHGQTPDDRPDLLARVFKMYLREFFDDMSKRYILGKTSAHIHVIEFQKRGYPHAHILIHFAEEDQLKTPDQIDSVISAEIPDPDLHPHLYELVTTKMMHGPCGHLKPDNVCMNDKGACSKGFPKEYSDHTYLTPNSYPHYRRRNDGREVIVRGKPLNNRWVVPYNPYILSRYGAHINVESVTSIGCLKYMYKYVYKGHDAAQVQFQIDEISQYLDARYVSATEGAWRLFEYPLQGRSHSVEKLPVHLPDKQSVFFRRGEEEDAVERALDLDTMLTAWFKLNASDEYARQFHYSEIPLHYCWLSDRKEWRRRKRHRKVVTRMAVVSPRDTERYHLRVLLLYVRGATSYQDLLTAPHGTLSSSFREACNKRNLLENDEVWKQTLVEASHSHMPKQLRRLFAYLLLFCEIADPVLLYLQFRLDLMDDYIDKLSENLAEQKALFKIEQILRSAGKTLPHFGLPTVEGDVAILPSFDPNSPPFDPIKEDEVAQTFTLNDEQSEAALRIIQACLDEDNTKPRLFFLNGPGGSGKTYTYNYLVPKLRSLTTNVRVHDASCSALTGIASTLLRDGKTSHSVFKIPIPCHANSNCPISPNNEYADFLRNITLFIIDEVSMMSIHAFHAIDRLMRDITRNYNVPFGGKVFVFGGDFRQLLPVLPGGSSSAIIENTVSSSSIWKEHVQVFNLTRNMRLRDEDAEQDFNDYLIELGDGNMRKEEAPLKDCVPIPVPCVTEGDLVDEIFPADEYDEQTFSTRAILCPTNQMSFDLNNHVLSRIPGQERVYESVDSIEDNDLIDEETRHSIPLEYLNTLTPSGMPRHKLTLKEGAAVMLLRNMDKRGGLTNGTRLIIRALHPNYLDAEVISGNTAGNRVFIPRMTLKPSDTTFPFTLVRRQFPIRLAYAMTINKSQGQTFEKIGVYLPTPCFAHGQLYVALSRARALDDIRIKVVPIPHEQGKDKHITYTKNIVYKQILPN